MKRVLWPLVASLVGCSLLSQAQLRPDIPASPKREVRAVWLATISGLDWPSSYDITEQRRSLAEIVRKLSEANFNTIFFQVRGRGDAMYRSSYEPWSQSLTGTLGRDPGWDPLEELITSAHSRGIEVHAWFNVFLVRSGGKPPETTPRHVLLVHPDWAHLVDRDWWLDPGIPSVRKYTLRVAMDIVRRYDIDGIHFDYMRYSGRSYPDEAIYKLYGGGMARADWRRENITMFVREFYDSATIAKPRLKVGSAPVGTYNGDVSGAGWKAYDDVYQDARLWLREGKQDYLAPQVYWSMGRTPTHPDFTATAKDWSENSYGRHIYIGLAPYKSDVAKEIPQLIDVSRSLGARGDVFYRYEHLSSMLDVGMRYRYPANIPPMPWKDGIPPNPPLNLRISGAGDGVFRLEWKAPGAARDGDRAKYYDVYRSSVKPVDTDDPRNLLRILPTDSTAYTDIIRRPGAVKYYYEVTALDAGNNESAPTVEESIIMPEIVTLARSFLPQLLLAEPFLMSEGEYAFFPYEIKDSAMVWLTLRDASGSEVMKVVDAVQVPGRYIAGADVSKLKNGNYTCHLIAGREILDRSFTVGN